MGFLQRFIRLILGRETEEDDEIERPNYPYTVLHDRRNDDFERLPKSTIFRRLICKVLQKVRFAFQLLRPRKTANPSVLPIQDPSNNTESLENVVISSPSNDSISSPETTPVSKVDSVYSDQQYYWPEEINSANAVIISIPEFAHRHPFAYTSASEETVDSAVVLAEQNADKVDDQREEEKVIIQTKIVVHVDELGKWIKHYSSRHRILLVGDGDFSFSVALARAFGCASNMISTSLDSKVFLKKHYQNAGANIEELRNRSCKVMHGIDATKMANHALLGHLTFDRIIYNFPYAGLILKELPRESQLKSHRKLVSQFLKNAKEMISENGEIHISHKTNGFHREWKLELVASSHRLRLIEAVDFNHLDYPGYSTKCGFGGDKNFDCYPSKTYKFGHKTGVRTPY